MNPASGDCREGGFSLSLPDCVLGLRFPQEPCFTSNIDFISLAASAMG
jgi:hypothetical protein